MALCMDRRGTLVNVTLSRLRTSESRRRRVEAAEDPISDWEIKRNKRICEAQGSRDRFVG